MLSFLTAIMPLRIWLLGALAALVIGGVLYMGHALVEKGVQQEDARINRANQVSEGKADDVDQAIQSCVDRHGSWDRFELVCHGAGQ